MATQTIGSLQEKDIAEQIYKKLGKGLVKTGLEKFIESDQIPENALFSVPYSKSIYAKVFLPFPGGLIVRGPTIQMYGHQFGTDKIGHFVQQGYEYFKKYSKKPGPEGITSAVKNGVHQEKTYFGTAVSGVYSNADLAANYAGMMFFINLTKTIQIGAWHVPPILIKNQDRWLMNSGFDPKKLLRPFVSEHWSEALNPSEYKFERGVIRDEVSKRCKNWREHLGNDFYIFYFTARMAEYSTWYGEAYGHRYRIDHGVSLAAECFIPEASSLHYQGWQAAE